MGMAQGRTGIIEDDVRVHEEYASYQGILVTTTSEISYGVLIWGTWGVGVTKACLLHKDAAQEELTTSVHSWIIADMLSVGVVPCRSHVAPVLVDAQNLFKSPCKMPTPDLNPLGLGFRGLVDSGECKIGIDSLLHEIYHPKPVNPI